MKTQFSPANNTIAVLAWRGTDTPVEKLAVEKNCILLVYLASIVKGIFTWLDKKSQVNLPAGAKVYFVASEQANYSYIVFLYPDGSSLCSCKEGRNHLPCSHTAEAALYEAACQAEVTENVQTYEFPSKSDPSHTYKIVVRDGEIDESSHEDCPGWHNWRHCWHMDEVAEIVYGKAAA